ncbi:RNase T-like protein, partial [Euroglyphus maynei]
MSSQNKNNNNNKDNVRGKKKIIKSKQKTTINGTVDTKIEKNINGNDNSVQKILNKFGLKENQEKIWFDGVDPHLIRTTQFSPNSSLCQEKSSKELTNAVAMDCEMVGIGYGGSNSALARVSIVNLYGHCVYDKYVKPIEKVTDYRTNVSGIRPEHLENATDFKTVQREVSEIIDGRILVGHAIHHDLSVLYLSHPKHMIRDTSVFFK